MQYDNEIPKHMKKEEAFNVVNFSEDFLRNALEEDRLMEQREKERKENGEVLSTEEFLDLNNVDLEGVFRV